MSNTTKHSIAEEVIKVGHRLYALATMSLISETSINSQFEFEMKNLEAILNYYKEKKSKV